VPPLPPYANVVANLDPAALHLLSFSNSAPIPHELCFSGSSQTPVWTAQLSCPSFSPHSFPSPLSLPCLQVLRVPWIRHKSIRIVVQPGVKYRVVAAAWGPGVQVPRKRDDHYTRGSLGHRSRECLGAWDERCLDRRGNCWRETGAEPEASECRV
jgi:hypothetical protein